MLRSIVMLIYQLLQGYGDEPVLLMMVVGAFALSLILGIGFHEFSHAWTAFELGDDTAARKGRLTLNPFAHIDGTGLILFAIAGFGWGKPTPVSPERMRGGVRAGTVLVAAAGPISNLAWATLAGIPFQLGLVSLDRGLTLDTVSLATGQSALTVFLFFFVLFNVSLGLFNLIPIFPLDGSKVVLGLLPPPLAERWLATAPWGAGILMLALVMGFVTGVNPLGLLIDGIGSMVVGALT